MRESAKAIFAKGDGLKAVEEKGITVTLACKVFGISQTYYRHKPKLESENDHIANWLLRLTTVHKGWGVGCVLTTQSQAV